MAKAKEGTAIAVVDDEARKALATYDYGDVDGGFDGGKDAFKMPWLRIAQSTTPQLETIEGMKAGDIFNTVTNQFWKGDEGILYIPAYFQQVVVEWVPRDEGGGGSGFVGIHDVNSSLYQNAVKALGPKGVFTKGDDGKNLKPLNPDTGNHLVDTRYAWGLHLLAETREVIPSCIAFSSTHIGRFIDWSTAAQLQTYLHSSGKRVPKPLPSHVYRITSEKREGNGNVWRVPVIKFANGDASASLVDPKGELFAQAVALMDVVKAGKADIDYSQQGGTGDAAADDAPAGGSKAGGKVPF